MSARGRSKAAATGHERLADDFYAALLPFKPTVQILEVEP